MLRNVDRILTTHAGRLDGPPDYALLKAARAGHVDAPGAAARASAIRISQQQKDAGLDIVGDGEVNKLSTAWHAGSASAR
jgi:hypothetical protein